MNFQIVRAKIIEILKAAAGENYYVSEGFGQTLGTEEFFAKPRVNIDMSSINLNESSSSRNGPFDCQDVFELQLLVSQAAKVDLSVLLADSATNEQRSAALAAMTDVAAACSSKMDDFIALIFQVIMASNKVHLDLKIGFARDRWMPNIDKNLDPLNLGERIVMAASMKLNYRVREDVSGETPQQIDPGGFDATVDIKDDLGNNAGVIA